MDKEHRTAELRILIQPSLYFEFQIKCDEQYKTMSEMVRELIVKYLKEEK